jgi:hypothetical protein
MAKALELTADSLSVVPSMPRAAQVTTQAVESKPRTKPAPAPKIEREPLQVRWPVEDVKAVKLAAIQLDFPTVSDFMLACFHAYMKSHKQA